MDPYLHTGILGGFKRRPDPDTGAGGGPWGRHEGGPSIHRNSGRGFRAKEVIEQKPRNRRLSSKTIPLLLHWWTTIRPPKSAKAWNHWLGRGFESRFSLHPQSLTQFPNPSFS